MQDSKPLLFIEPMQEASTIPVIDRATRRMTAAYRQATDSDYAYCGIHQCGCGVFSDCVDHFLPDGTMVNSLCVHYLALHRGEIPPEELARVEALEYGEVEPNPCELQVPEQGPGYEGAKK